jgi:hypothetical protein
VIDPDGAISSAFDSVIASFLSVNRSKMSQLELRIADFP